MIEQTRQLWEFWNKAKDHNLPKGSVLIVEDQIKTMWQDNEEPENCVNKEKDFNCLGDCLDIEDIISITKQRYAYISAEKVYGTWVAKFEAGELKKIISSLVVKKNVKKLSKVIKLFIQAEWELIHDFYDRAFLKKISKKLKLSSKKAIFEKMTFLYLVKP